MNNNIITMSQATVNFRSMYLKLLASSVFAVLYAIEGGVRATGPHISVSRRSWPMCRLRRPII